MAKRLFHLFSFCEDGKITLSTIVSEEQMQSAGTDKFCKWKDLDAAHGVSQKLFNETVSDMLELWENPIFEPPEKVRCSCS